MAVTTVRLRGEGNAVFEFDLPLSEVYTDQVRARRLVPDDDESTAALADALASEPDLAAVSEEERLQPSPKRSGPRTSTPKKQTAAKADPAE